LEVSVSKRPKPKKKSAPKVTARGRRIPEEELLKGLLKDEFWAIREYLLRFGARRGYRV
jgi:hypothetical protein